MKVGEQAAGCTAAESSEQVVLELDVDLGIDTGSQPLAEPPECPASSRGNDAQMPIPRTSEVQMIISICTIRCLIF